MFVLFCVKHDKRLLRLSLTVRSFQTSWPRVDEDDHTVIREAGEQRHLSRSSTLGTRGVDKVSVYGDASVAAHGVMCTPLILW